MQDYRLTPEQQLKLKQAHRLERNKKKADRIKAIYLLSKGWPVKDISEALLLDEDTIRHYWSRYQSGELEALVTDAYSGRAPYLNEAQQAELETHLKEKLYVRVRDIVAYVKKAFKVKYSISGMTQLLHALSFRYKKPKPVPGKANGAAQRRFISRYRRIKRNLGTQDSILFMDATHPEHQSRASCGWIKQGEAFPLKTTSQQKRLNIQGAINIETRQVITAMAPVLTQESTLDFLEVIRAKVPKGRIYLISDRARYYDTKAVKRYAKACGITMVYLPPYSPNLNPIERLWLYFHKHVTHNRYYKDFQTFTYACKKFFKYIRFHRQDLHSLITDNFQVLLI